MCARAFLRLCCPCSRLDGDGTGETVALAGRAESEVGNVCERDEEDNDCEEERDVSVSDEGGRGG